MRKRCVLCGLTSLTMKPNFYLFIFLFSSTITLFCCKSSLDCSRFKNGKFFTYSPVTKDRIIIERTDSLQIETNTKTGYKNKSKIVWNNPCEYDIIEVSNNKSSLDNIDSFFNITPIHVIIIGSKKDYYIFSATVDSANKHVTYTDTLRSLK